MAEGPFAPAFRTSWFDVLAILVIAAACPVVYTIHKYRKWRRGGDA